MYEMLRNEGGLLRNQYRPFFSFRMTDQLTRYQSDVYQPQDITAGQGGWSVGRWDYQSVYFAATVVSNSYFAFNGVQNYHQRLIFSFIYKSIEASNWLSVTHPRAINILEHTNQVPQLFHFRIYSTKVLL